MKNRVEAIFRESIEVKRAFSASNAERVAAVAAVMADALRAGRTLFFFGNGGSACDASHIAAEFVNRFQMERRELPAIALNTDMAVLTSISNDYDYSEIFSKQIRALGRAGDVVVGISTSGNSPNVLKGLEAARGRGMITVGLTGGTGGKMPPLADHLFIVPSKVTARIQETHITIGHVLCELIDTILFERPDAETV